jgi:hypothetical protein
VAEQEELLRAVSVLLAAPGGRRFATLPPQSEAFVARMIPAVSYLVKYRLSRREDSPRGGQPSQISFIT